MSERRIRVGVIVVDLVEAVSAFIGAIGLVVGFMNIPLSELQGTPFADYTVPALLLGFVVGGSALAAAAITWFSPARIGALASAAAGCITVGWLVIEIAMLGLQSPAQVAYFLVGLVMIGLAGLLWWAGSHEASTGDEQQPA